MTVENASTSVERGEGASREVVLEREGGGRGTGDGGVGVIYRL